MECALVPRAPDEPRLVRLKELGESYIYNINHTYVYIYIIFLKFISISIMCRIFMVFSCTLKVFNIEL